MPRKKPVRERSFAIGVDYGTNSVRALVVDAADGSEIATHVYNYPSGEAGILLDPKDPNLARQNPGDYIEGFYQSVGPAVTAARRHRGFQPDRVVGIGVDTTGSTPIPVARNGLPLALRPEFKNHLAAQAWLWKDHTAHAEAAEISEKARQEGSGYLTRCGGAYSSEWYWSKILHCKRTAPKVFAATYAWVELADFVPAFLTGNLDPDTLPRSICAAGHKALYDDRWGGLPKNPSSRGSIRPWPRFETATRFPRQRPIERPAGSWRRSPRRSAFRRAWPWPSAPSTRTWAPLGRA